MASSWQRLGTVTYSTGTSLGIEDFTAMQHLKVEGFFKSASGNCVANVRFNGDSDGNSKYPTRHQHNGGSESSLASRNELETYQLAPMGAGESSYVVMDIINIANKEKLIIGHTVHLADGTGASNAPKRNEFAIKWTTTSGQITRIDFINNDTGTLSTASTFTVWGADDIGSTPFYPKLQDGSIYEEQDTGKIYIWKLSTNTWSEVT